MNNWNLCKIGDILSLEYGKGLQGYKNNDGRYPVFGTNGIIGSTDVPLYSEKSIVIGRKGAYRGVQFAKEPFYVIDTAFYTKNKITDLDTKYLYYWFKCVDINDMDSGSAIPSTSRDEVYDLSIQLPQISEQKAIAEVLSSLDDKIDLLHRQNKTLESKAETLFRQWFVEEAKEEWELGELADVLTVKGGATPSTKVAEYWDGDICWTTPKDLSENQYIYLFDTARKISNKGLDQISSGLLPKGTLLLSSRAPVGYLAFAEVPIAINQGYIAIIDDKGYSKEYIYLWLKQNMDYVISYANGSTFLEISKSAFKSLDIVKPPTSLRTEFDNVVAPFFDKILANSKQIISLEKLRDSLLPKLMNGEVRVKMDE